MKHLLGQDDVSGRRDRQKFGEALDEADNDGLPDQVEFHAVYSLKRRARGQPFSGMRPAWARAPRQNFSSLAGMMRLAQDSPSSSLKPWASASRSALVFCSSTPRPRPISGT